MVSDRESAL